MTGCCPCLRQILEIPSSTKCKRVLGVDPAVKIEQAFQLSRKDVGSWQPSWQSSPTSKSQFAWATPVPTITSARNQKGQVESEFELIMADFDSDSKTWQQHAGQDSASKAATKRSKWEMEQLFASPGTLPKPMVHTKKEANLTSQPTATFEMLSKIPHDLLDLSTTEAQELRRSLVKNSTVVFMSAGYPGKRFIFERAAELGVKSVIIDHPDSWSRGLVDEGLVAKFIPVDMTCSGEEIFARAISSIRGLGKDGLTGPADAVTTMVELSVSLVARLCEALGLPGSNPEAVDIARDKHRTRIALRSANLPTPRNAIILSAEGVAEAGTIVGFPAVLKPVSGAASLGVKKVSNGEDLQRSYKELVAELGSLVVSSGALMKGSNADTGVEANKVVNLTLLLEQYLDGDEVDIDIVMSEGEWRYACVSDNGPTIEPYFNETWGVCPSLLPKSKQNELKALAIKCTKAMGFTAGVFHVECKSTSSGPQLVEVNARMGGGPVRDISRICWGVDLVEETIFVALGIPSRPPASHRPLTCLAYNMLNCKKSGRVLSTAPIEELVGRPGVLQASPLIRAGDVVVGADRGLPTWAGMLMVADCNALRAKDIVLRLEAELDLEIV